MAGTMWGADVEAVEALGSTIRDRGDRLRGIHAEVRRIIYQVPWEGGDGAAFAAEWEGPHRARLEGVAAALLSLGDQLVRQATEQREASGERGAQQGTAFGPLISSGSHGAAGAWADQLIDPAFTAVNRLGMVQDILAATRGWGSVPGFGYAVGAFEALVQGTRHGFTSPEALGPVAQMSFILAATGAAKGMIAAGVLTTGATAGTVGAAMVASFGAGWTIGTVITDHTQIDEGLADWTYERAYGGDLQDVPDRSADWYRSASPAQIEAHNEALAENSRLAQEAVERSSKPWLVVWDTVQGGHR